MYSLFSNTDQNLDLGRQQNEICENMKKIVGVFDQNRHFLKIDLIFIKLKLNICYYIHWISFVMYFDNIYHMTSWYSQMKINLT